ncbi:MAG TPA: helix-turn-helix transcriptional regulator [Terriglobales bacterium]|nr:helix-turn-helix transcriptional regulator [Terriglobales bacterium]
MKVEKDILLQAFANALRVLRHSKGFSQEKLALEGISRGHISDLERGRRDPRLSMMWYLAELLNVPFTALAREVERQYAHLEKKNKHE